MTSLKPASKKANQSGFLIFRLALVQQLMPLLTEQYISQYRAALVDTFTSQQGSDGGVIAASKVHMLLTRIHDILYSAMSKWLGNIVNILAYLFNLLLGNVMK